MTNSSDARIAPEFTPTRKQSEWWYQQDGQSVGPIAEEEFKALIAQKPIEPSTLVWCQEFDNDWMRLDATNLWRSRISAPKPPPFPPQPTSAADYDPKWKSVFDAAAAEENSWSLFNRSGVKHNTSERTGFSWKLQSIPGFIFGPLYYFYLRMWRKGILLAALLPVVVVLEDFGGCLAFI